MKYEVELCVDATKVVEVEADTPEEAMDEAVGMDIDCGELNVSGIHALGATDENGNVTESGW